MKLSILIPVFNERLHVERLLDRVLEAPLPEGVEREVLVVDDGSTDGTSALLEPYLEAGRVRLHRSPVNCGKGTSVRIGIALATGDWALIQDADLEYSPDDYPALVAPLLEGRAEVVFGSRFLGICRGMTFWHHVGNRILSLAASWLFGARVTDAYTCYKVLPLTALRAMPLRCRDFDIEAELTARILQGGLRLVEVPIRYEGRSHAEGKKIRKLDGVIGLLSLIRFRCSG